MKKIGKIKLFDSYVRALEGKITFEESRIATQKLINQIPWQDLKRKNSQF